MNPKPTANLDPKLREAYERIMGTTIPPVQPGQNPTPTPVSPTQTQVPTPPQPITPVVSLTPTEPISPPQPHQVPQQDATPKFQVQEVAPEPLTISTPNPSIAPQEPAENQMVQSPQSPVYNSKKSAYEQTPTPPPSVVKINNNETLNPKKKGKIMPVVLTLGGLVFFVVYGVIWAKVFSLF